GGREAGREAVDVVESPTRVDGAAEDVPEHGQEQRTLNCSQHEQLRRAEELEDGSLGALERGGHEAGAGGAVDSGAGGDVGAGCGRGRHDSSKGGQAASADSFWGSVSGSVGSSGRPVTARNTSSRLGRRSPTSSTSMPRSSSVRTMSRS